jgi:hypothetical protein
MLDTAIMEAKVRLAYEATHRAEALAKAAFDFKDL